MLVEGTLGIGSLWGPASDVPAVGGVAGDIRLFDGFLRNYFKFHIIK